MPVRGNKYYKTRNDARRWQLSHDPFDPSTLARCTHVAKRWLALSDNPSGSPILMTYATRVEPRWLLGLSAASHRVPLVLVGPSMPAWKWYEGGATRKVPGVLRALQVLHEVATHAPVALVDSSDLLIANEFMPAHAELVRNLGPQSVMTGGECNSWPVCYRSLYASHPEFQGCVAARHAACYPNGGVQIAPSPGTLSEYLRSLLSMIIATRRLPTPAERGYDQAALHRLYLGQGGLHGQGGMASPPRDKVTKHASTNRSASAPFGPRLRVDGESSLVLQLWSCGADGPSTRSRGGKGGWEYCSDGRHEPLTRISTVNGSARSVTLRYNGSEGVVTRPWLLHANGRHSHMAAPALQGLLRHYVGVAPGPSSLPPAQGAHARESELPLMPDDVRWGHPVLVLESYSEGACFTTTLGWLLNNRSSAPY